MKLRDITLDKGKLFDHAKGALDSFRGVITGATGSRRQYKYQTKLNAQQYAYNKALQDDSQDFNASEAQKARDYETEMSNSAYQRQKADLISAGYNPLLAINSGGASTPSAPSASSGIGSTSSGSATEGRSLFGDILSLFSVVGNVVKLGSEISSIKANTAASLSHADLMNQQAEESSARTALASAQAQRQALENVNFDVDAFRRKQKYGEGPHGLGQTFGGIADDVAKGASKIVDKIDGLGFGVWSPSANSAKGATKKINAYQDELGQILDKVLDSKSPDTPKRKGAARAASSWLPSHF